MTTARKTTAAPKCLFGGCKNPVCWEVRQLFGKRLTTHACADHKPGNKGDLAAEHGLTFYEVNPIAGTMSVRAQLEHHVEQLTRLIAVEKAGANRLAEVGRLESIRQAAQNGLDNPMCSID
jgi:hypothetical protein